MQTNASLNEAVRLKYQCKREGEDQGKIYTNYNPSSQYEMKGGKPIHQSAVFLHFQPKNYKQILFFSISQESHHLYLLSNSPSPPSIST